MLDLSRISGSPPSSVLSGKQRGETVRSDFKIEALDHVGDDISVRLPEGLDAITPSFVLGLFGRSVQKLGSIEAFFAKYQFDGAGPHLQAQIRRGAEYSLVRGNPL
ncbi:hypothetical protein J2Y55_004589 [Bosea sp. BE125]|uniref:hypothetical protein n=1 Tax=Bosea sp. BE125 TaxID=2817909 RepID=UPI00285B6CA9|nr:hypothetical protein [Bosea sp. BE125]MDR6873562.1 hypothetical protein [Bosea sp. BE125]